MTSSHERTEMVIFAAITLAVAAGLCAMSVTSDRARESGDDRIGVATSAASE